MNNWFTVKVKYTKQLENGTFKRVSEPYLLCAMTFTDAETRIYEELRVMSANNSEALLQWFLVKDA